MNANAVKYSGRSDPLKHYHRLYDDAKEFADELVDCAVDNYALVHLVDESEVRDDELMDDLRRIAALVHQWRCSTAATFRDGITIEQE